MLLHTAPNVARAALRPSDPLLLAAPPSETSWVVSGLLQGRPYRLSSHPFAGILERFLEPYRNHTPEWRAFLRGHYGQSRRSWVPELCWEPVGSCVDTDSPAEAVPAAFEALPIGTLQAPWLQALPSRRAVSASLAWGPRPEDLAVVRSRSCPPWKSPSSVVVTRVSGEREVLRLTDCDGAIQSEALERVSVLARAPNTPRPELPLPEPVQGADGEALPDVRLLHPRLIWVLGRIAEAFPRRAIVVYSGYRRDGHSAFHGTGRALDIAVNGLASSELFAVCRQLRDVGCGFYPNNRFVHVDVRPYGTGHVAWVDTSEPGEPSTYVDGWPGVLPPGVAWLGSASRP